MTPVSIDLNADLGEGFGRWTLTDDEQLLSVVTSANVACGFHAGDAVTMRRVCELAAERGVRIGAQVSYRDLAGFGRRAMDVPPAELAAEVAYQIGALEVFARAAGSRVAYVKPHGALYNRVVRDEEQAAAVVEGVLLASGRSSEDGSADRGPAGRRPSAHEPAAHEPAGHKPSAHEPSGQGLPVLGLPGSRLHEAAVRAGLPVVGEAFGDRAYRADGTLLPRGQEGAVVTDPAEVVERSLSIARFGAVTAHDGRSVAVRARSLCLHGDTPGAVELARRVRARLESEGVRVEAFA
ncbi:5-oxoprolinase subunit PxpA [Streptomyces roseoviridis]|uniref:5-oxoprolinase subunit A n=1 Tax=Streptomyces roseoviridis TaxID=67361 RepID=A0ABV5QJI8_9ACTN